MFPYDKTALMGFIFDDLSMSHDYVVSYFYMFIEESRESQSRADGFREP